jgi:predicted secreted hydrolase
VSTIRATVPARSRSRLTAIVALAAGLAVAAGSGVAAPAVAAGSGVAADAGAAPASTSPTLEPVVLPRDHGAHPGFGIEWWYTAGTLRGGNRHDYFYFATIWSSQGVAVAKVNVVDLRADRIVLSHEYVSLQPFAPGATQLGVGTYQLGWRPHGKRGIWTVDAPTTGDPTSELALKLTPEQPYVLNDRDGIIRQGSGARSAYYSAPRLRAQGVLELDGRRITVSGLGWFDHQWGNFADDAGALRWNWFACQFRGGSDLMLYQFLNRRDRPSRVHSGTLVSRSGRAAHLTRFKVVPLRPRIKPAGADTKYPLRWRLEVPVAHIRITLEARARRQFIVNQYVPSFWEGAAVITAGRPGQCIVESSRQSA